MASRRPGFGSLAAALTLRALAIGALGFGVLYLAVAARLYALAALLVVPLAWTIYETRDLMVGADEMLARLITGLTEGASDRSRGAALGLTAVTQALSAAQDALQSERMHNRRTLDHHQALIDTVTAALIIVDGRGRVLPANAPARRLLGEGAPSLSTAAVFAGAPAAVLQALPAGGRDIVTLNNGEQVLAYSTRLQSLVAGDVRLLSLQSVSTELAAVEVKAWRELTRVLAHEMMNSLTPIASLAQSLRQLSPKGKSQTIDNRDEIAEVAEIVWRRSTGLMDFVDRYRRIADVPQPQLESIPLCGLLEHVRDLLAFPSEVREVSCSITIAPDVDSIWADRTLLEQALINILSNALEAVENAEQPAIAITCIRTTEEVIISIEDNGPGLTPPERNRVFLPFYTTKKDGSGIGLTLSRQIALSHGGHLLADASELGGARFCLHLPATPPLSPGSGRRIRRPAPEPPVVPNLGGLSP